jgi:hypothetical protein
MYVKALAILLLLSGLIAGLWKLYDAGGDAREAEVRLEYTKETLKLVKERDEALARAETRIIEDRVIYRERVKTIQNSISNAAIPDDIERVLCDSGVFTGCKV